VARRCTVRDDGLGGKFTSPILRPVFPRFFGRFLLPNFDLLIARKNRAVASGWFAVRGCNLYELRFGCDGLRHVRVHGRLLASRVDTLCGIFANCKSFLSAPRRRANRAASADDSRDFLGGRSAEHCRLPDS
jgi:hypothetical protein